MLTLDPGRMHIPRGKKSLAESVDEPKNLPGKRDLGKYLIDWHCKFYWNDKGHMNNDIKQSTFDTKPPSRQGLLLRQMFHLDQIEAIKEVDYSHPRTKLEVWI